MTIWVCTREADDARTERSLLEARGYQVVSVPCLTTRFRRWPWRDPHALTLFTSKRAVEAWRRAGRPALSQVAALARGTASALGREGITPQVTSEGGSAQLAQAVLAHGPFTQVRYPTSNVALSSPEQLAAVRLLEQHGRVDRQVVYEVHAPPELARRLTEAIDGAWIASFSSPSAVRHFLSSGARLPAPSRVVCLGLSTAHAWDQSKPADWPEATHGTTLEEVLS